MTRTPRPTLDRYRSVTYRCGVPTPTPPQRSTVQMPRAELPPTPARQEQDRALAVRGYWIGGTYVACLVVLVLVLLLRVI